MTIKNGDKIPAIKLFKIREKGIEQIDIAAHVAGKKVVLFAVPGAFTPTCSQKHLPSYVANADKIKKRGIDEIICVSVNDPFVMKQWGTTAGAAGKVTMMSDGNGELTKAIGMEMDGSGAGLGKRSKRYSMVLKDGTVTDLQVEDNPGEMTVSGAEACLVKLGE